MDNIFIIAAVVSVVFLIAKFIEMRFIEKESKPLKFLIRDALLVYFSVVSGYFIIGQINKNSSLLGFRFYLFEKYCMGIWPLRNIQYSETRIRNKIKFITLKC